MSSQGAGGWILAAFNLGNGERLSPASFSHSIAPMGGHGLSAAPARERRALPARGALFGRTAAHTEQLNHSIEE